MTIEKDPAYRLDQAISELPKEIVPERDLWPALQQKLPARHSHDQWQAGVRWAAVFALFAVSILGWRYTLLPVDGSTESLPTQLDLVLHYEQRKAEQMAGFGSVSESFADWQQQLGFWDQAVAQVQMALDFYPEEPALLYQLETLYEQQLAYLDVVSTADTFYY